MDFKITKREVLVSIAIICVMLLFGFIIAGNINDNIMDKNQEYNTALQIDNDSDLFKYGMKTNIGNAFVYGDLKTVDTVTYPEIEGQYSYVEKIKERYTMHTRTVTTVVNGKTQTRVETYWSWDKVDSESKHCKKITFLGVEFDYGMIDFPGASHVDTIKESSNIRYKYYGAPTKSIGTLYAQLDNNTINNVRFSHNQSIEETLDIFTSGWELVLFWIVWAILIIGSVIGFYYIDNRWLEDY